MRNTATRQPPLALYIHFPWCARKCPYCDFNSHEASTLPESAYVNCLLNDLDDEIAHLGAIRKIVPLTSIFIGGGTPSLIQPEHIARLLDGIRDRLPLSDEAEVTLEANPGSQDQAHFQAYKAAGVNRLSIGVQSFQDELLERLGRIHNAENAHAAVHSARSAGFRQINLDLMHGLPGQKHSEAMQDLETALSLQVQHLSWYQLTLEPNTQFYSRPPVLPSEDQRYKIYEEGMRYLQHSAYQRYEVSAWCLPGCESRHNLNYWRFGDYLGIGAGAHGKISDPESGQFLRRRKMRQPDSYIKKSGLALAEMHNVPAAELPFEFLLNALRLPGGVSEQVFIDHTGLDLASLEPQRTALMEKGLLVQSPGRLACTELGLEYLNDVLQVFMEEPVIARR